MSCSIYSTFLVSNKVILYAALLWDRKFCGVSIFCEAASLVTRGCFSSARGWLNTNAQLTQEAVKRLQLDSCRRSSWLDTVTVYIATVSY